MDQAISFAASTFRKVLKGFEIGGLQYNDVQFHLQRLLAAGTPPQELREVLRRCERITPLPEYAHAEVVRLLDEALEQEALTAQQASAPEPIGDSDSEPAVEVPADLTGLRVALEEQQLKTHDLGAALAERIASEQAARARGEEARRDAEQTSAQLRSARQSLAARDAVIGQMRVALDESNARLVALQTQQTEAASALESQSKSGSQLAAELQSSLAQAHSLSAQLAELRTALESEQRKRQEAEKSSTQKAAQYQAALESQSKSGSQLTADLQNSRAQVQALTSDHTALHTAFESEQRKRQESEQALAQKVGQHEAAVTRRDDLQREVHRQQAELSAARDAAAAHAAKFKSTEADLQSAGRRADALAKDLKAAQRDLGAQGSESDKLRSQIDGLNSRLKDNGALIDRLQQSVRGSAKQVAELQAAAKRRESSAPGVSLTPLRPAAVEVAEFSPPKARVRWQPRLDIRLLGIGAAILLLAMLTWAVSRHAPAPAKAPAVAAFVPPKAGTVLHDCPNCPSLTVLPAGRFEQGTAAADQSAPAFEKPLHWVAITHPFAMSTNPVTVDEFRAFAADTGRDMQGCDTYDGEWRHRADNNWKNPGFSQTGSYPVTCTSWNDAKAYAAWLSAKTGHRYRLPTASEWEYAARAGGAAVTPWSDAANACSGANVADQSAARHFPGWAVFGCDDGYVFTAPVGSFKANSFGLNDMLGNVFEWTEDCWHADYTGAPVDGSARTDGDCTEHELRGGSWFTLPGYVRANYRNHFAADYRTSSVGIRVVRDLTT